MMNFSGLCFICGSFVSPEVHRLNWSMKMMQSLLPKVVVEKLRELPSEVLIHYNHNMISRRCFTNIAM